MADFETNPSGRFGRLDPRVRLLSALVPALVIAACREVPVLLWALAAAALLAALARLPAAVLARRLLHLNLFMAFLWVVLPLFASGAEMLPERPGFAANEGVALALAITLKGNALVLLFTVLITTMPAPQIAYALQGLGVPHKLVYLFSLATRYTELLREEHQRLRNALRARVFQPDFSRHTLRTMGYMVGMLLVRSLERSERVLNAMLCRGFDGRYRCLAVSGIRAADYGFAVLMLSHAAAWIWLEFQ